MKERDNIPYFHIPYQVGCELLSRSSRWVLLGCEIAGSKRRNEARCRPPRSCAWLRGSTVSPYKADFDLRETRPLPRNILLNCEVVAHRFAGQRTNPDEAITHLRIALAGLISSPVARLKQVTWFTLFPFGIPQRSGLVALVTAT